MAPDIDDSTDAWSWAMLEPELSDADRAMRERFVEEYLKDEDAILAASRCGFQFGFAKEIGIKFLGEAYVQKRLQERREKPPEDAAAEEERLRLKVLRRLESEASDMRNSSSSRVAALAKLAVILGMDAPTKSQQTITHQGGVMMVPQIADLGQWEKTATKAQELLVADARAN